MSANEWPLSLARRHEVCSGRPRTRPRRRAVPHHILGGCSMMHDRTLGLEQRLPRVEPGVNV